MDETHGERNGIPRQTVASVVAALMMDAQVKWVAIIHEDSVDGVDRFNVVPYTSDPTS